MVAKIADLGVARIAPHMRAAATMTTAPGAGIYMPPEAIASSSSDGERSKYDASIDIFSLGVVTIFTIGETFPCDPLAPTYTDETSGLLVARSELQRRSGYMQNVNSQLQACGQLCEDHPLIRLIRQCLQNLPAKRPGINEVLCLLEEARARIRDEESEWNKRELVRALQNQPMNQVGVQYTVLQLRVSCMASSIIIVQNLERVLHDLMTVNADLQQQLRSSEREKQTVTAELREKEAELTKAEETIRRE